jgi:hypothetical protein
VAESDDRADGELAPPSEAVHLPGPSYLPVIVAVGISLAIVGVVINWVVFGIGMIVFLGATIRWIRETREDIAELPLDH